MRFIEILASLLVLRGFYAFATDVLTYLRRKDAEIELEFNGDRITETRRAELWKK